MRGIPDRRVQSELQKRVERAELTNLKARIRRLEHEINSLYSSLEELKLRLPERRLSETEKTEIRRMIARMSIDEIADKFSPGN
ncbi:MAG: hypothetical protein V3U49_03330 [Nitrososphaerales archaeon]